MSKLAEIEALLFVAGEEGITARQIADLLSLPPTGVVQSLEKLGPKIPGGHRYESVFDGDSFPL